MYGNKPTLQGADQADVIAKNQPVNSKFENWCQCPEKDLFPKKKRGEREAVYFCPAHSNANIYY